MKFILKFWFLSAVVLLSVISYVSVLIPPTFFWPVVFFSYAIPGVLIMNIVLLFILVVKRSTLSIIPAICLLAGLPFILISFSFKGNDSTENNISVLSFNAKLFRKHKTYEAFSFDMIKWVVNDSSAIKCIQEYCTNSNWRDLDVTKKIANKGYNAFTHKAKLKDGKHDLGLGIFTTYPILNSGIVWEDSTLNGAIFTDLNLGSDTIRVYNVHFASMGLKLSEYKQKDGYAGKLKKLVSKLKNGATRRSHQIDKLIAHTATSPYSFIICGDFNETPYSYNYFRFKANLKNAFEEAGNGFGFSLNSPLFFLRIDHQFYNSGIKAINYEVDRSMKISDHFPTRAVYKIEK